MGPMGPMGPMGLMGQWETLLRRRQPCAIVSEALRVYTSNSFPLSHGRREYRRAVCIYIGRSGYMAARIGVLLLPLLLVGLATGAEESLVPPADGKPVLQLDAGGPMAAVTALAFAPDGKTLYVGGYDKIVRAWVRDEKNGKFTAKTAYHIPIGPGLNGLINALAVSPDGKQLAAAGSGAVRGTAG